MIRKPGTLDTMAHSIILLQKDKNVFDDKKKWPHYFTSSALASRKIQVDLN